MTEMPPATGRTPCPDCGSTSLKYFVHIRGRVPIAGDIVSMRMRPGAQPAGWLARWEQVQRDATAITKGQSTPCDAAAIKDASARLYDAFVDAYHLKDHLKAEVTTVTAADIEDEITKSKALALCADLANTDKHAVLTRQPRSGSAPSFRECAAESSGVADGWMLDVVIDHDHSTLSGTDLLREVIDEWERLLDAWGLI